MPPAAADVWFRAKALFAHSRTILAARVYSAAGVVVVAHDALGSILVGQDFTPISTRIMDVLHVAQDMRGLAWGLLVSATGALFEWLRHLTTQSLADNKADSVVASVAADAGIPSPPAPPERLQP